MAEDIPVLKLIFIILSCSSSRFLFLSEIDAVPKMSVTNKHNCSSKCTRLAWWFQQRICHGKFLNSGSNCYRQSDMYKKILNVSLTSDTCRQAGAALTYWCGYTLKSQTVKTEVWNLLKVSWSKSLKPFSVNRRWGLYSLDKLLPGGSKKSKDFGDHSQWQMLVCLAWKKALKVQW